MSKQHPPRFSSFLLKLLCRYESMESMYFNFCDEHLVLTEQIGRKKANSWFRREIFNSFPGIIKQNISGGMAMFLNNFKLAVRNIVKYKIYSIINVAGLAAGMAAFILVALYVRFEFSYDTYHEKADRIYRAVRDKPHMEGVAPMSTAVTPAPLSPALLEEFPEIETAGRVFRGKPTLFTHKNVKFIEDFYWGEGELFDIFYIPFLQGDPATALKDPASLVISEKIAHKYFGNSEAVGKTFTANGMELTVSGVFQNMPDNSHFVMDIILPYKIFFRITDNDINGWGSNFTYTYFTLKESADVNSFQIKLSGFLDRYIYDKYDVPAKYRSVLSAQPLKSIHLHSHRIQEISKNNDIINVIVLFSLSVLFLLIACINYMNLATARLSKRGREIGIRKVAGARKSQLVKQFLTESVSTAIVSLVISLSVVALVLPWFNNLVERNLALDITGSPQLFVGIIVLTLLVGLFSGSYPAFSISKIEPASVLKVTFYKSGKGLFLRNLLVLAQFSITIIFIVLSFGVLEQLDFVKNKNMGYNRDHILTMKILDNEANKKIQVIKEELAAHKDIISVSESEKLPDNIEYHTTARWEGMDDNMAFSVYYNFADYDYADVFGLEIISGRNFSRDFPSDKEGVFLVNEAYVKAAGFRNPLGREVTQFVKGTIIGVVKDFHLHSLHRPIEPMYIYLSENIGQFLSMKISSHNLPEVIGFVEKVMKKFSPEYPFEYRFFDEIFDLSYKSEVQMSSVFTSFALLAVVIACMGLFGLTAFSTEQRTKEMGIRKVLGATNSAIIMLFSKEFLRWILLANIIAWPAAYFLVKRWLEEFTYHVDISISLFISAAGLALLVAFTTISYQTLKTVKTKPSESLKYE